MAGQRQYIKLHQSLHGYSEGHRLIESSIKLPSSAARVALVLSDMSGPSMFPGFESYISGYPLPDVNMYAFGRTWYAPEMSRPGCVWTHTLLVENADLAQILNLSQLLDFFIRPDSEKSWVQYKHPLEVPPSTKVYSQPIYSQDLRVVAHKLLEGLYRNADVPVYLESDSSLIYEDLLLSVWSQQWPRLRRHFRFCSGALSNRKADGKPFDLQVIPRPLSGHIKREIASGAAQHTPNNLHSIAREEETLNLISSDWLSAAAADLETDSGSDMRQFLWKYGAELVEGRQAFAPLVEIYMSISDDDSASMSPAKLLRLVATTFPADDQASRLKQALFGAPGTKNRIPALFSEKDVLRELVMSEYQAAFKSTSLLIRERAKALLKENHEAAITLALDIIANEITPLGEEFLTAVCEEISIADALYLSRERPDLLPLIVQLNPILITEPVLWRHSSYLQRELFDTVMHQKNVRKDFLHAVIPVLLDSGSDDLVEDVVSYIGIKDAVIAVLEWLDSAPRSSTKGLSYKWRQFVKDNKGQLLRWLLEKEGNAPRITTLAFIANMLDPNAFQTINAGSQIWLPLAEGAHNKLDYHDLVGVMSFLLALGFNNPPPTGVELVKHAFEIVYTAAEQKVLTYNDWRQLQSHAPSLSVWRSGDWCERLRYAFVYKFIGYNWPHQQFLQAVEQPRIFHQLLQCAIMSSQGQNFLKMIKQDVAKHRVNATPEQQYVLKMY